MKTIELTRSMNKVFDAMRNVHRHLVLLNDYIDRLESWHAMKEMGLLDEDMTKPQRPDGYPTINF